MQIFLIFFIFQEQGVSGFFLFDYWKFKKAQERLLSSIYIAPYFGILKGELIARAMHAPVDSFGKVFGENFGGMYRKSIFIEEKNYEFYLFDFYKTFGRGLVFSFIEKKTIELDRFIRNGLFFSFHLSKFSFSFLYGKPVEYLYYARQIDAFKDTLDEFRAFDFNMQVLSGIELGSFYTQYHSKDFFGKHKAEFLSGRFSLKGGWLKFYQELLIKKGWDKYAFEDNRGFANYLQGTISVGNLVFDIEYEKYRNSGTPYSLPPSINNYGLSLTKGANEEGYAFDFFAPFLPHFYTKLHYSKVFYKRSKRIEEFFGEMRFDRFPFLLILTYDDIYFLNAGIDVSKRHERKPELGFFYTFFIFTSGIKANLRTRKDFLPSDSIFSYKEPYITCEFLHPYGSLSLNWTCDRRKKDEKFLFFELRYQVNINLELYFFYGKQKSDIVCSGGTCRYEPEFNGAKIKGVYSF